MTNCPACKGSGLEPAPPRYLVAVGKCINGRKSFRTIPRPRCRTCDGTGRLVDVLIR